MHAYTYIHWQKAGVLCDMYSAAHILQHMLQHAHIYISTLANSRCAVQHIFCNNILQHMLQDTHICLHTLAKSRGVVRRVFLNTYSATHAATRTHIHIYIGKKQAHTFCNTYSATHAARHTHILICICTQIWAHELVKVPPNRHRVANTECSMSGVAVCCSVLLCCSVLHCIAVLQCVAVCCSVMQCDAVYCRLANTHRMAGHAGLFLQSSPNKRISRRKMTCSDKPPATHCDIMQHTATHCNTLQHTATHCNTRHWTHCDILQHTAPKVSFRKWATTRKDLLRIITFKNGFSGGDTPVYTYIIWPPPHFLLACEKCMNELHMCIYDTKYILEYMYVLIHIHIRIYVYIYNTCTYVYICIYIHTRTLTFTIYVLYIYIYYSTRHSCRACARRSCRSTSQKSWLFSTNTPSKIWGLPLGLRGSNTSVAGICICIYIYVYM